MKKNILHISANSYNPINNDSKHHTQRIWEELSKKFNHYHVLARSTNNSFSQSQLGNITLHTIPKIVRTSKIFVITSLYMFWLIPKHKINVLLVQCPIAGGLISILAKKIFNIPVMIEIHGEEYFRYLAANRFSGKLVKFVLKRATAVRSLNSLMTQKLAHYGIAKNVIEIPNRVNLQLFNKTKNNYTINFDQPLKLISVGRFVKEKDYLRLIQNLEKLGINYHLTLIGGGVLQSTYQSYIDEHNIQHKVNLISWIDQPEMIDKIIFSDIYIQSSISEGMPRTILEAMALQMPIITTSVGSIAGVIENGKNGVLIDDNTVENIRFAINELVDNEAYRIQIAKKAYLDIVNKYEWNKVFELYSNTILALKN